MSYVDTIINKSKAKVRRRLAVVPSDPLSAYDAKGNSYFREDYYNPNNHFSEVFCFSPLEDKEQFKYGMHVIPTTAEQLPGRIRDLGIDVVRAYGGYWACDYACENKVEGVPVVVSVHDTNPKILHESIHKADYVFAVSQAVKNLLIEKGVSQSKISILPNRVDLNIFRHMSDAQKKLEFSRLFPGKYRILHVGRKTEQKNLDTVIRSLPYLGSDYSAIFIGIGDKFKYEQLAKDLNVIDRCYFIDSVPNINMASYYSFCDCMCTPSRWEGFGIVFLEALACQAIVVTSDIAPMNELIIDGYNGLLVKDYESPNEMAKAIKIACTDTYVRSHLFANARNVTAKFDKQAIDQLESNLYEHIIEEIEISKANYKNEIYVKKLPIYRALTEYNLSDINVRHSAELLSKLKECGMNNPNLDAYWDRVSFIATNCYGNVLEIGCGCGNVTRYISQNTRVSSVTAIDQLPEYIDLLKNYNYVNVKALCTDVLNFETSEKFDCIVLAELIEHVSQVDENKIITILNKILKSNSKIIITTPIGFMPDPDHVRGFTPEEFVSHLTHNYGIIEKLGDNGIQQFAVVAKSKFNDPLVTVVLPTYNHLSFLPKSIESLLLQTFTEFELIIVNDGSTDGTMEFLDSLSDPRIRIIHQNNSRLPSALNAGFKVARGRLLTWTSADNYCAPHFLETFVSAFNNHPEAGFAYSAFAWINESGQITGVHQNQDVSWANMVKANPGIASFMYRKECHETLGWYDPDLEGAEDWDMWLRIIERYPAIYLPDVTYYYRLHNNSMTATKKTKIALSSKNAVLKALVRQKSHILEISSPLISVIVPTYNRPDMLKDAIQSILDQTFQNFEIIVVNDAGGDVSTVIKAFNSPKLYYLSHETNKGLAGARNTGIRAAGGKYIAYLDDDDIFYPDHLATLVTFLQESGEFVAYSDAYRAHQIMQGDGVYAVTGRDVPYSFDFNFKKILIGNYIPVTCFMHDIKCIQEAGYFDESLHSHEDWDLWIRMSQKFPFHHIKKLTCEFRWREDGTSMTSSKEPEFISTQERIYEKYRHISSGLPDVAQAQRRELYNRKKNAGVALPVNCSIVIPVFNQVAYTKKCLEMLYANTPEDLCFEVIIVDNASSDETAEFLNVAAQMYRNLRVIHNNENLLFAKACNQGAQAAQGEYLVFLNNDTEPLPGWLDNGLARLKSDPTIGVVGSKLIYPDGTIQHCGIEFVIRPGREHPWPEHRFRGVNAGDPRVNVSEEVYMVTGACLFISKVLFYAIGGFCPDYGMYFEDIDLCMKVRKQNKIIWYEPLSILVHHEAKSSPSSSEHLDSLTLAASVIFYKRWLSEIKASARRLEGNSSNLSQNLDQNLSVAKKMPVRVLYDISVLGLSVDHNTARTGIFRVVEHVARGLAESPEIALVFCSTQALIQYAPYTENACRRYLAEHPEFSHVPFCGTSLPAADIFHSPFHGLPDEVSIPIRFLTVYDLIPVLFPHFVPDQSVQLQKHTLQQLRSDDRCLCISQATKSDLCTYLDMPQEKAAVSYLAADPAIFYPCTDLQQQLTVRQKYNLGDAPYILSLCTLEPRKNIDHLLRAFARLVREGAIGNTRLVLTGTKGWDFDRIFSEIDNNPELHKRIVLTGYVPDEELAPLYSGAQVFAYMSQYEGFGLPPLEAMQCGTPVITSNTSSLPEVVGDAGIMLDPRDMDGLCQALVRIISNDELRDNYAQLTLKQAAQFSWNRCVEETIAAYRKALAGTGSLSAQKTEQAIIVDGVIFQLQHGRPFGISRLWQSLLTELGRLPIGKRIILLDRAGTAPNVPGIRKRQIGAYTIGTAQDEAPVLDRLCTEEEASLFLSTYYTFITATPSLLMLYDMIPEQFDTVGPTAPNPEWRDKYHAIMQATAFAAISASTVRDLVSYYPEVTMRPMAVVPCAVSETFRPHSQEEIAAFRAASGITKPYFLLVGRRDQHKNVALFFEAFEKFSNRADYALVMAGTTQPLEPELREMAGDAEGYAGFFTDEALSLIYSGAVALVYPSRYEGFGLPILEAMQSGCPVITCQNSSLPEVAGSAALYVGEDAVDEMLQALQAVQQPEVREYLLKRGQQRATRFSWQDSAGRLVKLIDEVERCHD